MQVSPIIAESQSATYPPKSWIKKKNNLSKDYSVPSIAEPSESEASSEGKEVILQK